MICFLSSFRILTPMLPGHLGTETPLHVEEQTWKSQPWRIVPLSRCSSHSKPSHMVPGRDAISHPLCTSCLETYNISLNLWGRRWRICLLESTTNSQIQRQSQVPSVLVYIKERGTGNIYRISTMTQGFTCFVYLIRQWPSKVSTTISLILYMREIQGHITSK